MPGYSHWDDNVLTALGNIRFIITSIKISDQQNDPYYNEILFYNPQYFMWAEFNNVCIHTSGNRCNNNERIKEKEKVY